MSANTIALPAVSCQVPILGVVEAGIRFVVGMPLRAMRSLTKVLPYVTSSHVLLRRYRLQMGWVYAPSILAKMVYLDFRGDLPVDSLKEPSMCDGHLFRFIPELPVSIRGDVSNPLPAAPAGWPDFLEEPRNIGNASVGVRHVQIMPPPSRQGQ